MASHLWIERKHTNLSWYGPPLMSHGWGMTSTRHQVEPQIKQFYHPFWHQVSSRDIIYRALFLLHPSKAQNLKFHAHPPNRRCSDDGARREAKILLNRRSSPRTLLYCINKCRKLWYLVKETPSIHPSKCLYQTIQIFLSTNAKWKTRNMIIYLRRVCL